MLEEIIRFLALGGAVTLAGLSLRLFLLDRRFIDELVACLGWSAIALGQVVLLAPPPGEPHWAAVSLLNPGVLLIAVGGVVRRWPLLHREKERLRDGRT